MPQSNLDKIHQNISKYEFFDEKECVQNLLSNIKIENEQHAKIQKRAIEYVEHIKSTKSSLTESFIHEYSLSNEEGVAIMCLAESLLRIPDSKTAKELISDKLKDKNWIEHAGKSKSTFVNASTWGLVLTGKVIDFTRSKFDLGGIVKKLGQPVILAAVKRAIKMISNEFILGENLEEALKNAKDEVKKGYKISFDILGESSRTDEQAEYYYNEYIKAIAEIAKHSDKNAPIYENHNLSVKLTALHPRVNYKKYEQLKSELLPKLVKIVELCKNANISLSFDAEESFRQDIYLKILTDLITHEKFNDFEGIGFVIQGYSKRTFHLIDYIVELAKQTKKRMLVRLVKGAYWDGEVKFCQEYGMPNYPLFTKKEFTDVSYIACAQKLLANNDLIYAQFATHNAHTIATIENLGQGKQYEFQKLQGMGGVLHDKVLANGSRSRIYAPVGKYEDLLAYLMRRLLENGANSSFVNMIADESKTINELVESPIAKAMKSLNEEFKVPLPKDIWGMRDNSLGYDLGYKSHYELISSEIAKFKDKKYEAYSIIEGKKVVGKTSKEVIRPNNHKEILGTLSKASDKDLLNALEGAENAFASWSAKSGSERAKVLHKFADLMWENRFELYSLLINEAGKNIDDSISEVREAIDFAHYYAMRAVELIDTPIKLPSYTGEENYLSWHPRGVFVCISPWNFPLAIFVGQILAALVTGNTVLAKPAENTSLIATFASELLLKSGVDKVAYHLLVASGRQISEQILTSNKVRGVCFTGSNETAARINLTLAERKGASLASLIAETGGQNCMIVDSSALLEQTADAIVHSAFGSVGQRCSALRIAFIQEEIYEPLIKLIIGSMNQLRIGDTADLFYDMGAAISHESSKELQEHVDLITKKKGCKLLAVHKDHKSKNHKDGSYFVPHLIAISKIQDVEKENFGPILHVISYKASELDEVIEKINNTGFGLTFGVQSRIEDKIEYIASRIKAGNIYANRTMIGAQVGTHPFGGENNSGTGFKAGGPHYLMKFMTERAVIKNMTAIGGNLELLRSL